MVRPAAFGYNPETAASNAFQKRTEDQQWVHKMALKEFDQVVLSLRERGIQVIVVEDTPEPQTTDAVFPNNWITTHEDGKIILYPMMAPGRRKERRDDVVQQLKNQYNASEIIDLSEHELEGKFLEGTGSI
ncbi:MAG TPA: amidinotransferase, partial [Cytophagales bacterium]|nr:amidinotransferase [Cytophagales bacterium]